MNERLQELYDSVLNGDTPGARAGVQAALDDGIEPGAILNDSMIAAMREVGRLFEEGEYFVPEMLVAARAMQQGLAILRPYLASANVQSPGRVAIGTVKGDLHDIGKNLVGMMLEGAGFDIVDLGTDVPPERFVQAAVEGNANIIALSALLTTTMPNMKVTIEALKLAGVRDRVKVLVGGAPVTEEYARQIGADGFAPDAGGAALVARSLVAARV